MLNPILMAGARHRTLCLIFLGLVTWAAVLGLPGLAIETGLDRLVPRDHPDKRDYDAMVKTFGSDNRCLVYVGDKDFWTADKLSAFERLHFDLDRLEFVSQVDDLFTLASIRGSLDQVAARTILVPGPREPVEIEAARQEALDHPLLRGNILSRDGKANAVVLTLDPDVGMSDQAIHDRLEQTLAPYRPLFQDLFQVSGPRINTELTRIMFRDLKVMGPLSALILAICILFFLRSGVAAAVPLATAGLSILWTLGFMGWAGLPLNILSGMLPSLIVVIGSTEDTHMLASYFQGLGQAGKENPRVQSVAFMVRHLGIPVILTILTTALGFGANLFNSMEMIRQFALAALIAVLANGLITLILVPLLLTTFGPLEGQRKRVRADLPQLFVRLFGVTKQRFPRPVLAGTALLCAFFIFQCAKLYVTNDPLSYFQPDLDLIRAVDKVNQNLSGMRFFYITLDAVDPNAFHDPENLKRLSAIQNFMEKQGGFDGSLSLADHLAMVNQAFHGGDIEQYRIPEQRKLVAQYLLFFHRRDLRNYVSHDGSKACIVVRHHLSDSGLLNRRIRELKAVVPELAGPKIQARVLGQNLMINAAAEDLLWAQVKSLAMLLSVIFAITAILFTSLKGGIISLVPSLIPVVLMFGIMGLLNIPLNPGTAMVAVIAIGIAVDNTLHLFFRYNEICRRTSDYDQAVLDTVAQEATPMVTTSLALALGFGILSLSKFSIIAQFGALSAATMLFALFANLFITPLIMSRTRLVGLYQILALDMHRDVIEKSPLFRGMSRFQMRKAILISELHEKGAGELLIQEGRLGRSMYLLLKGEAEVVRTKGGQEVFISGLGPGQIFGEIGFVQKIRRTATVRAVTPVEVLRFDYFKLEKDLRFFPHIAAKLNFNISRVLGERLAEANDCLAREPE